MKQSFFRSPFLFWDFLFSVVVRGDCLGEDTEDHGYKTEDSKGDYVGHGSHFLSFSGLISFLTIKTHLGVVRFYLFQYFSDVDNPTE